MTNHRQVAIYEPPPNPLARILGYIAAVDEQIDPAGYWPQRPLDHTSLFLTVSGSATSMAAGHIAEHRPGTLVAIARGTLFSDQTPPTGRWHLRYLMLGGDLTGPLEQALGRHASGMAVYHDIPETWRTALTRAVHLALRAPPNWSFAFLAQLSQVIADILAQPSPPVDPGLIQRVADLYRRDPRRQWTVAGLAASLRLGPSSFAHRFRLVAGCGPAAWIRRQRLEAAAALITEGLSVNEVAARLGYCDPFHLSRLFSRRFGQPPSRHRRGGDDPLHP